jgi:hypothetical protein
MVAMCSLLLQRDQVGDQLVDLVFGQVEVGHAPELISFGAMGFIAAGSRSQLEVRVPARSRCWHPRACVSLRRANKARRRWFRLMKCVRFGAFPDVSVPGDGRRSRGRAPGSRSPSRTRVVHAVDLVADCALRLEELPPSKPVSSAGSDGRLQLGSPSRRRTPSGVTALTLHAHLARGTDRRTRCTDPGRCRPRSAWMHQLVGAAGHGVHLAVQLQGSRTNGSRRSTGS